MIIDANLIFSDEQALDIAAGSVDSTNIIDMGALRSGPNEEVKSRQQDPFIYLQVTEAFTSAGAATLVISIQHSDTVGSGYVERVATPALALATLVKGMKRRFDLSDTKRFVKIIYTVGTATTTAGKVDAVIALTAPEDQPTLA